MNAASELPRNSITNSPWYWVYLFCTAGAIGLLLAGPKFAARQSQIERNHEARQYAAQHVAKQQPGNSQPPAGRITDTRVTLWPLYVVLGCLLTLAWFNLWRHHQRRRATVNNGRF